MKKYHNMQKMHMKETKNPMKNMRAPPCLNHVQLRSPGLFEGRLARAQLGPDFHNIEPF